MSLLPLVSDVTKITSFLPDQTNAEVMFTAFRITYLMKLLLKCFRIVTSHGCAATAIVNKQKKILQIKKVWNIGIP